MEYICFGLIVILISECITSNYNSSSMYQIFKIVFDCAQGLDVVISFINFYYFQFQIWCYQTNLSCTILRIWLSDGLNTIVSTN